MDALADLGLGLAQWRTSVKLALQDIELRYKRSLLGPFWISATLVVTILTLSFLYSAIFQQEFRSYTAWLGAGLIVWNLIQALINESCVSILEHGALLQNVPLPLTTAALRIVIRNGITFLHNFVALLVTFALLGVKIQIIALMVLPSAAAILVIGFFAVLALGPICTRFRDIPQVISSIMQIFFFLTPILWVPSPHSRRPMLTDANPFFHLIQLVRSPLLGNFPSAADWLAVAGVAVFALLCALASLLLTRKQVNLWL